MTSDISQKFWFMNDFRYTVYSIGSCTARITYLVSAVFCPFRYMASHDVRSRYRSIGPGKIYRALVFEGMGFCTVHNTCCYTHTYVRACHSPSIRNNSSSCCYDNTHTNTQAVVIIISVPTL